MQPPLPRSSHEQISCRSTHGRHRSHFRSIQLQTINFQLFFEDTNDLPSIDSQTKGQSFTHLFLVSEEACLYMFIYIVVDRLLMRKESINLPSSRQTRRPLVSSDLLRCGNDWPFRPGSRADFPSGNCLHHTTTRHFKYSKSKRLWSSLN